MVEPAFAAKGINSSYVVQSFTLEIQDGFYSFNSLEYPQDYGISFY